MLRQALLVMVSVCLVLSSAVWLLQALRLIDLIVNRGLSVGVFLHLAILILPRFIVVVLPIAVFVAVLFVYNKLIAESELVVMRAAGVGPLALARPALITGALGMLFLFALTLYLLPAANRSFKDLQFEIRNRFASILIQDGVFNTISDRLMVYVRSRDASGELAGILIYDNRQPDKPVTVFAEPAVTSARPSGSVVAVGYHRRSFMSGSLVQVWVTGSKMLPMAEPTKLVLMHSCPPATSTRPSGRTVIAEQKMSRTSCCVSLGTGVKVLVAGSHKVALMAPMQSGPPSHIRIFPVFSSTMLIATSGQFMTLDHWPTTAGSARAFTTVMLRDEVVAVFPAASRARAEIV